LARTKHRIWNFRCGSLAAVAFKLSLILLLAQCGSEIEEASLHFLNLRYSD
jgi:hypothetical protein